MGIRKRNIQKSPRKNRKERKKNVQPAKQSWRKVQRLSLFVHEENHKKGANPIPVQLHINSSYMEKTGIGTGLKNDEVYPLQGVESIVV